jgi:hypothetical protein
MGRACSAYGAMKNANNILVESLKERDHPEDVGYIGK